MIQFVLFLFIGVLLFSSLFFLARRNPKTEGSSGALVEARQALDSLQGGLLPSQLVGRIFAVDDLEYVESNAPADVCAMFRDERKRVALAWVAQVHKQTRSLMRFHRGAARFYSRLNFKAEMGLAMDFWTLLVACRALQLLVYVGGPYAAPRIVGATALAAGRVCKISEESLAFLNAARLGTLANSSTSSATL
jgi:hypothetical protein